MLTTGKGKIETLLLAGIMAAPLGSAGLFAATGPPGRILGEHPAAGSGGGRHAPSGTDRAVENHPANWPGIPVTLAITDRVAVPGRLAKMTTAKTITSAAAPLRVRVIIRLAAAITCAGIAAAAAGCGSAPAGASRPQQTGARPPQQTATGFLAAYARPDGRVVRPDQGGDTVSEGQAYGMLLAETAGNHDALARIWKWTRDHLQLGDGLFAWHADAAGKVVGQQPASDADLLIAWALLRYHGPGAAAWHRDGRRVANAILAREVTTGPGGVPVLTAGPWASGRPASLDPSYWSLTALNGLAQLTGRQEWGSLAAGAVTLTSELTRNGQLLPPDWAELTATGALRAEPAPD